MLSYTECDKSFDLFVIEDSLFGLSMSSRSERVVTRSSRRSQQVTNVNGTQQSEQPRTGQAPIVSGPPTIDVDAIEDDDDVVESTASAFDRVSSLLHLLCPTLTVHVCVKLILFHSCFQAKRHKSGGSQRGPLVVDVESGEFRKNSKRLTLVLSKVFLLFTLVCV